MNAEKVSDSLELSGSQFSLNDPSQASVTSVHNSFALSESASPLKSLSKLSILQDAAREVNQESTDKINAVVTDVQHTPYSPGKEKKNTVTFNESALKPEVDNFLQDALGDIQALMKEIDIPLPKQDVKKPIQESKGQEDPEIMQIPSKSVEIKKYYDQTARERYLHKRNKILDRNSNTSPNQRHSNLNIISTISDESRTLRSSFESGLAYKPSIQNLLTKEKEMLFLRMRKVSTISASKSERRLSVSSESSVSESQSAKDIEQLAKKSQAMVSHIIRGVGTTAPGKNTSSRMKSLEDKMSVFSTYDDAMNCTFQPTIHKYRNSESKSTGASSIQFYDRQDAIEKSRRERHRDAIGMKEYDQLLNKKYCPSCGSKQSYDEVKEKRKKCSICNVEFRSKLVWNTIAKKFLGNENAFIKKLEEKKALLEAELLHNAKIMKVRRYDRESGAIKEFMECSPCFREDNKWTKAVEDEFFDRLSEYHKIKEKKLKKLEEQLSAMYPFKPTVHTAESKSSNDWDDDDDEKTPSFEAFLKRYYDDLTIRHQHVEKIPYSSSRSISAGRSYSS